MELEGVQGRDKGARGDNKHSQKSDISLNECINWFVLGGLSVGWIIIDLETK